VAQAPVIDRVEDALRHGSYRPFSRKPRATVARRPHAPQALPPPSTRRCELSYSVRAAAGRSRPLAPPDVHDATAAA
jgi:hypothetical protein